MKRLRSFGTDTSCSICLESITKFKPNIRLETCSHCFHKGCMMKNIRLSFKCPLCRTLLNEKECSLLLTSSNANRFLVFEYSNRMTFTTKWYENGCAGGSLLEEAYKNESVSKCVRHILLKYLKDKKSDVYKQYFFCTHDSILELPLGYIVGIAQQNFSPTDWSNSFIIHSLQPAPFYVYMSESQQNEGFIEIQEETLFSTVFDIIKWGKCHCIL